MDMHSTNRRKNVLEHMTRFGIVPVYLAPYALEGNAALQLLKTVHLQFETFCSHNGSAG
jgi:hypothetical protein